MVDITKTDLERQLKLWIRKNKRENSRLEFKLKVDFSTPGAKAEFIRDVIALANSEGESPRDDGYLVVGFREGDFYEKPAHYEGATFGQILDSNISPTLRYTYDEFTVERRRIGVLTIRPDTNLLYVVKKQLQDENGHVLLSSGQSWGRKADRKTGLTGEEIHKRLRDIAKRQIEEATRPLRETIEKMQREAGPAFEVKRIRFEMERTSDWSALDAYLDKLMPYAREFDDVVKHEVLDAVREVHSRTREGMPIQVAESMQTVLMEVMPDRGGGFHYPAREPFSEGDQELLKRVERATFDMTWDACRYLRDMQVLDVCARLYSYLIRCATLNRLRHLQAECLNNARRCQYICLEERGGMTFPEGYKKLAVEIAEALDAFDCDGYTVATPAPNTLPPSELAACIAIIKSGGAVDWNSAKQELPLATALAIASKDTKIVGVGAIKRGRSDYAAGIAAKSGVDFPIETLELGYVAVTPEHRGHHLSDCIVKTLLRRYAGRLFATTYSEYMKDALIRAGFQNRGKEWQGRKHLLSFWEREPLPNT